MKLPSIPDNIARFVIFLAAAVAVVGGVIGVLFWFVPSLRTIWKPEPPQDDIKIVSTERGETNDTVESEVATEPTTPQPGPPPSVRPEEAPVAAPSGLEPEVLPLPQTPTVTAREPTEELKETSREQDGKTFATAGDVFQASTGLGEVERKEAIEKLFLGGLVQSPGWTCMVKRIRLASGRESLLFPWKWNVLLQEVSSGQYVMVWTNDDVSNLNTGDTVSLTGRIRDVRENALHLDYGKLTVVADVDVQ